MVENMPIADDLVQQVCAKAKEYSHRLLKGEGCHRL